MMDINYLRNRIKQKIKNSPSLHSFEYDESTVREFRQTQTVFPLFLCGKRVGGIIYVIPVARFKSVDDVRQAHRYFSNDPAIPVAADLSYGVIYNDEVDDSLYHIISNIKRDGTCPGEDKIDIECPLITEIGSATLLDMAFIADHLYRIINSSEAPIFYVTSIRTL